MSKFIMGIKQNKDGSITAIANSHIGFDHFLVNYKYMVSQIPDHIFLSDYRVTATILNFIEKIVSSDSGIFSKDSFSEVVNFTELVIVFSRVFPQSFKICNRDNSLIELDEYLTRNKEFYKEQINHLVLEKREFTEKTSRIITEGRERLIAYNIFFPKRIECVTDKVAPHLIKLLNNMNELEELFGKEKLRCSKCGKAQPSSVLTKIQKGIIL